MTNDRYDRKGASSPGSSENDIISQLRRLPDVDPLEGLSDRIINALHPRRRPWWHTLLFRLSRPLTITFTPLRWVAVGAALMVGLVIGFGLDRMQTEPESLPVHQLAQAEDNAALHFKLGRLLLAGGQVSEALAHLKRAADVHPDLALYHFWVGVNYWRLGDAAQERSYYQQALKIDPDFLPAHVYLGHNHLDLGDWQVALSHYRRVLEDVPHHPEALFNVAVALQHQGEPRLENDAWIAYLDAHDRGAKALRAVARLNANGDFTFRNIQLGPLEIVKRRITFSPEGALLEDTARDTLADVGRVLANNRRLELHVVAYVENDAPLARLRARAVKQHLAEHFAGVSTRRIKLSWFGVPEKIQTGGYAHELGASVHLFAMTLEKS